MVSFDYMWGNIHSGVSLLSLLFYLRNANDLGAIPDRRVSEEPVYEQFPYLLFSPLAQNPHKDDTTDRNGRNNIMASRAKGHKNKQIPVLESG